jgi:hypothetical protein
METYMYQQGTIVEGFQNTILFGLIVLDIAFFKLELERYVLICLILALLLLNKYLAIIPDSMGQLNEVPLTVT